MWYLRKLSSLKCKQKLRDFPEDKNSNRTKVLICKSHKKLLKMIKEKIRKWNNLNPICHLSKSSLWFWIRKCHYQYHESQKWWSDSNEIRTHNHLVCKQTPNHLAKLAQWLSRVVSAYLYSAFDCMLLSCHVQIKCTVQISTHNTAQSLAKWLNVCLPTKLLWVRIWWYSDMAPTSSKELLDIQANYIV